MVLPRPPTSSCREVDVALFQWLNQKQAERTSDSGHMCTESQLFHEALGLEGEFSASVGWPTRFRQPHDIYEIAVQTERETSSQCCCGCMLHAEYLACGLL